MAIVVWTPRALAELEEIADYITEQSNRPRVAEQMLVDIRTRAEQIAVHPRSGSRHPNVPEPLRVFVHKRWVVVYEPRDEGGITIVRIIDGSRDFTKLF